MSQATQGILILTALLAIELVYVVVVWPELRCWYIQRKQARQKQQNQTKE